MKTVANLAVPRIADWCAVDILDQHGRLERLAVAHVDPAKVEYARTLQERYPEDPESPTSVTKVARTGQPLLVPNIPDELIVAAARDQDHLRVIRALDLTSYICVPLMVRGKAFGALSFVAAESGRHYTEIDLQFAQDVAARASLAVENARAYQQAHEANRLKDDFLGTLSHELRTPLISGKATRSDERMSWPEDSVWNETRAYAVPYARHHGSQTTGGRATRVRRAPRRRTGRDPGATGQQQPSDPRQRLLDAVSALLRRPAWTGDCHPKAKRATDPTPGH